MKSVEQQLPGGEDLHADAGDNIRSEEENPSSGFDEVERLMGTGEEEREISWLNDVNNDASIFCDFPPLPDFPCMSSSSSTPLPVKAINACSSTSSASTASSSTSASSSAASWAVLKTDADEDHHHRNHNHQTAADHPMHDVIMDGMDVMENFGYMNMDLLDNNDFFDPSSIFHHDDTGLQDFEQQIRPQQQEQQTTSLSQQVPTMMYNTDDDEQTTELEGNNKANSSDDDLAIVFLEWLKTNEETVSAEDLRKVKIKKATIECAAKRLGGGKEAMKQLLTLILQWVQTNHLHKRRFINESASIDLSYHPNQNNFNCNHSEPPNSCFSHQTVAWNNIPQPPPYVSSDPGGFAPVVSYMTDPFANGAPYNPNYQPPPPADYNHQMLDSAQTWPASQFGLANSQYNSFPVPDNNNLHPPAAAAFPAGYPNPNYQYVHGYNNINDDQRFGSSATKEARKKRMARQRRFAPHHRNHQQNNQSINDQQHARLLVNDSCVAAAAAATQVINHPGNWIYWPSSVPGGGGVGVASNVPPVVLPAEVAFAQPAMQLQGQTNYQRQVASDRRQGWKTEKNLRFLLQKVLKQSDVGNLGRIVLPKKEAETHLPGLEARDGISIAMEDIGTSRVWNMRYRFWPNNKSRMYLLENTGDFVRTNGLQEGDFIVIYSDVKCGKYLIRGVKVRQSGAKPEITKRPGKSQKNQHAKSPASAINGSSSSLTTQTVK